MAVTLRTDFATLLIFTRATRVLAVVVCLSAVCLLQVGVLLKRLNVGSRKQRRAIAHGLYVSGAENLGKTQTGSSLTEAPNAGGVGETQLRLAGFVSDS